MLTIKGDRIQFSKKIKRAIRRDDKETIITLLEGVNPCIDIRDHTSSTLLHLAIKIRNYKIIKFFIDRGCDINAQDQNGTTPLLAALKLRYWHAVRKLLEAKVNIFLADNKGINALKMVLQDDQKVNRAKLIELFTKHLRVCGLNGKELAPLILEAGWPLHYAIDIENSELIKLMIEAGCSIGSQDELTDNMTALHKAIYNGDLESTKILLQYGANLDIYNDDQDSPLELASNVDKKNNGKIFELFLERELQRFNTDGGIEKYTYFFHYASAEIIKLLVKYKVNLTTKDRSGSTLLHSLVYNDNQEVSNLILNTKIDVDSKDIEGNTALYYAVNYWSIKCIKALIKKGANVNTKNKNGHTPLIYAINKHASKKVIETLINNGAILDEEMQNHILNEIIKSNFRALRASSIMKQMAIMHLHCKTVSKRNEHLIKRIPKIHSLFELCLRELHLMKHTQVIANSDISVFDILCVSEHQLFYYARNKDIVQNIFKIQVGYRYPIYGKNIITRCRRAYRKQKLNQNALNILSNNIKQLNCNLEIIANIVKYLSPNDLAILSA